MEEILPAPVAKDPERAAQALPAIGANRTPGGKSQMRRQQASREIRHLDVQGFLGSQQIENQIASVDSAGGAEFDEIPRKQRRDRSAVAPDFRIEQTLFK